MRRKSRYLLALALFGTLAVTFDGFSVAAVIEAGFDGVLRFLLMTIGIVVGTVCAYTLTAQLIHRFARPRGPNSRSQVRPGAKRRGNSFDRYS
jgi:hypothetical protein